MKKFRKFQYYLYFFAIVLFSGATMGQSIQPITWNVVGLDSNNVSVGPNVFPIGVRICNTSASSVSAGTWQAKFNWVTTSSYVTRSSNQLLPVPTLTSNACQDIFHEVTVTRDALAYDQRAQYNIEVVNSSGNSLGTPVRTPSNREIYVEHLISQNRNAVDGYDYNGLSILPGGSINVAVGQTFDLSLRAHTATQGYEQLEKFLELNPSLFRVNKITSTYSANAGTDSFAPSKLYADGCGWQNDLTATTGAWQYHNNYSCSGTGKYGGTITLKYNVTVLAAPSGFSAQSGALIYDFSGSSYHYNADFSSGGLTFNFVSSAPAPSGTDADVELTKTVVAGNAGSYTFYLTANNLGPNTATNVVVSDVVPDGYTIDNNQSGGWTGFTVINSGNTIRWTIVSMTNGSSLTLPIKVNRVNGGTNYVNTATVSSDDDPNASNNSSSVVANVALADLAITKLSSNSSPSVGDVVTFTVKATNLGPDAATGVSVSDAIPSGYTVTGSSATSGIYSSPTWTIGSLALNASATLTVNATVNASGSYVNLATVSSTTSDPVSGNNTASADATPTYLALSKTTSDTFTAGATNKVFTVTAYKTGTSLLGIITVQDLVPNGMTLVSMSGTGWTCSSTSCTRSDNIVATSGFPIAYPAITVTVNVANPAPASLTNTSYVYSSLVSSAYAQAQRTVSTSGLDNIDAVDDGTTTLVPAASGTTAIDLLANDTYNGAAAVVGTNISAPTLQSNGGLTGASIGSNQLQVPNNAAPGTYAVVYQICSSATPSLCDTAIKTIVVPAAEIEASISGFSSPVLPGATVTGIATCTNSGSVAALNATCVVSGLPVGATTTCSPTSPQASLAAGAAMVCSVSFTAPASGTTTVLVTTGANNDNNASNNTASSAVVVNATDIQASISGFSSPVLPGATVTGTATCTNIGSAAALNATCVVSGLPVGATTTCSPTSPQASLAAGAAMVCSVSFTAPASGTTTVLVTAGANNDNNASNNTASSAVVVNETDMRVTLVGFPASTGPGIVVRGTMTCTNQGVAPAVNANCTVASGATIESCKVGGAVVTLPVANLPIGSSIVCTAVATAPGSGSFTVNVATTAANDSGSTGKTASQPVSVVATAGTGRISGTVWYDLNANNVQDNGEPGRSSWTVQLLSGDVVLGSTTTNGSGNYSFSTLQPGIYAVQFINANGATLTSGRFPVNGDPNGNGGQSSLTGLSNITVAPGGTVVNQSLPLDPSGVVYSSLTRQPIVGATVTLLYNGAPIDPAWVAGASATQVTGADGRYAFFILPAAEAGTYSLTVSAAGHNPTASTIIPPSTAPGGYAGGSVGYVGAPPVGQDTTYYLSFPLPTIDIINNNIPLDAVAAGGAGVTAVPGLSTWAVILLAALMLAAFGVSSRRHQW